MKEHFDLIVVIPVGPGTRLDFLTDTMNSVAFYIRGTIKFILIDDSQKATAALVKTSYPDIDIITLEKNFGKVGGLYISLSDAFRFAYEHYEFTLLLRMDDDALMIGPDADSDALAFLNEFPQTGMMGRHIRGRFSADDLGNIHDNAYPRNTLLVGTCTWKFIRRPLVNGTLRQLMLRAFRNGYELGENIQGGAYFITRACIGKLLEAGFLPLDRLKHSILCEDHLFSLLVKVAGMELRDFSGAGQPFACAWKGLPAAPETLTTRNKKIIHSVRFWEDRDQEAIRKHFKQLRNRGRHPQPPPHEFETHG